MASMNISLPNAMKQWAESRTVDGRFSNVSDYVRDLIRRNQERVAARAELPALISEGLASCVSDRSMGDVLREARARAGTDAHPRDPEGR